MTQKQKPPDIVGGFLFSLRIAFEKRIRYTFTKIWKNSWFG